jgi:hypothetical protein
VIRSMAGSAAEAGFFLTHVAINGNSPALVTAIEGIFDSVKANNVDKVVCYFEMLVETLKKMLSLLKRMYVNCDPNEFNALRAFLHGPSLGS